MHSWVKNPKAPSSLWDGLVLDGAYAGLHPGTNRFVDGSGLENHGTLTNMDAASDWVWVPELGRFGVRFSAANSAVTLPSSRLLGGASACALSFWIRSAKDEPYPVVWSKGNTSIDAPTYIQIRRGVNQLRWTINSNVQNVAFVEDDTWKHVCCDYTGSQQRVFVNGSMVASASATLGVIADDAGITGIIGNASGLDRSPRGVLVGFQARTRALAPAEIEWLANPSHRMYEPDTRRHFWFPMGGVKPWMIRRHRRMTGAR